MFYNRFLLSKSHLLERGPGRIKDPVKPIGRLVEMISWFQLKMYCHFVSIALYFPTYRKTMILF